MRRLALVPALLLAGCGHAVVKEKPVIQYVEKRVACPSKEEYDRLKATRPTPLIQSLMPPTAVERNARSTAQLGLYEATGGWADQVVQALDRCQVDQR